MPFEDPWFREGKTISPLDYERRMFEVTGNPLHVWRAYEMCSELMRAGVFRSDALPAWILDYFDTVAAAIQEVFHEAFDGKVAAKQVGNRVMKALKMTSVGQGARGSAFTDDRRARRDYGLALAVWTRKNAHPSRSIEQITEDLSEEKLAGVRTLENAWATWHRFLEERERIPPG